MRKSITFSNHIWLSLLAGLLLMACSESRDRVKITQHVYKMDISKAIDEVFLETQDIELLSRIVGCTPSTVRRLKDKVTLPTEKAEEAFKSLLIEIKMTDNVAEYLELADPNNDCFFRNIKL